jgi:glycosyltransferase involved in cell wall biosynthesis
VKKLRILMYLSDYYPVFTGHGIYLTQLMSLLQSDYLQIGILTWDHGKYSKQEIINGFRVNRIASRAGEKAWELKQTLRTISYLYRNLNTFDILHMHGHLDHYGLITLFSKFFRKKIIMQMVLLGSDDPASIRKSYKFVWLRFRLLSLIDKFIYISKPIGQSCLSAGIPISKLTYIPQGVDVLKFSPATPLEKNLLRGALSLSLNAKIVVFVGAVIYRKGIDILLDAWPDVQSQIDNSLLILVGTCKFDDENENKTILNAFVENIKSKIKSENLNVEFIGRSDCVENYLKASDVFVLPSRKEGFGNVIIESMACGIPPVVTYMDGVSHETVIDSENGFIVNNHSELSERIIYLLRDHEKCHKIGLAARAHVLSNFDIKFIANKYLEAYKSVSSLD